MEEYFDEYCTSIASSLSSAPSTGTCSQADIIDRVTVSMLDDLVATVDTVAFSGLVTAFLFIYVAAVTLIALNFTWDVCLSSSVYRCFFVLS